MRSLLLVAAALGAAVACSDRGSDRAGARARALPDQPVPLDLGQQPLVNPLNLWEMMIEGSPDHESVGRVGERRVTTRELDDASARLLTRIGDRTYLARDRGWQWLLEQEGLARAAAAANKDLEALLADEFRALPAPTAEELEALTGDKALAGVPPEHRPEAARTLWRLRRWSVLRSVLIDEGLAGVPRERAQLMLVNPAFASPETSVGKIGDRVVSRRELHLAGGYQEQALRHEYHQAAKLLFEQRAEAILLEDAAAAAGVGVDELLAREYARLGRPPAAEVEAFVVAHPEYRPHPERAADAVRTLREAAARDALLGRLAEAAGGLELFLREPKIEPIPARPLAPRRHGDAARADVLEVLHCVGGPTCARGNAVLATIVAGYGDRLRVELGDYFEDGDVVQLRNALAMRCAEEQGRGWAMFERLTAHQTRGVAAELAEAAAAMALDRAAFGRCLAEDRHLPLVVENTARAAQLGLEQNVLGVWVNGVRLDNLGDLAHVRASIDGALR